MGAFMAYYRREDPQGNGEVLMEEDGMDSWERPISADEGARSAFILGILSIVFSVICQVVGLILGIIGLSKAKRSDRTDKEGEAAWVLSVIAIVLGCTGDPGRKVPDQIALNRRVSFPPHTMPMSPSGERS